jgi:DNA modification methylase
VPRAAFSGLVVQAEAGHLPLPDDSVDLICTSPPYYGLRDYRDGGISLAGQIGAEATPQAYVKALVDCTREFARVLKPGGSLFVVLGDKYSQRTQVRRSSHRPHIFPGKFPEFSESWAQHAANGAVRMPHQNVVNDDGLAVAEKSLMQLPQRYAIACTDELGLIKRAEIIWSKVNATPESVRDRVHLLHEWVLHFTLEHRYYSAVDEIREPYAAATGERYALGFRPRPVDGNRLSTRVQLGDTEYGENPLGKMPGSVWRIKSDPLVVPERLGVQHFAAYPRELARRIVLGWSPPAVCLECGQGRFPVTVSERVELRQRDLPGRARLNAEPLHGPDKRAGTHVARRSEIVGYACACTPYTDHPGTGEKLPRKDYGDPAGLGQFIVSGGVGRKPRTGPWREYHLDGWTAPPSRPSVVLDPFGGTGTTALVASVLGRIAITSDLSADYCRLSDWRVHDLVQRARAAGRKPPVVSKNLERAESAYGGHYDELDKLIAEAR